MTSTVLTPARAQDAAPPVKPVISSLDLAAGGSLLAVALVAWASLALAHLGRHSLPAVVAVAAVAALGLVLAAWRSGVRVRSDRAGLLVGLGCAAVAALLVVPGFSYGVADKDPGGYVSQAIHIAHTGSDHFVDPLLSARVDGQPLPVPLISPGARLPGVWVQGPLEDGNIVPQFYHLWPALLATGYDLTGIGSMRVGVSLVGVLSVLVFVALLRRVGDALGGSRAGPIVRGPTVRGPAGLLVAAAGGLLLATNMLQVWQARYPSTEVLAQALYLGALLGVVVALQTRWAPAAGAAGLLTGVGFLNRADGVLLLVLAAGVGAALLAARRFDARAVWFTGGATVVLPHALLQAYDLALPYTRANSVPTLAELAVLLAGLFAVAAVLRLLPLTRWVVAAAQRPAVQRRVGLVVVAGAAVLLLLGFLRPWLFGRDYFTYNARGVVRSYDEQILARLSWFLTVPGFVLMLAGLAVVALGRWRAAVWTAVVPTLLLLPLYAYSARNSTRLLWWTRRYVPTVLPGILLLVALALAAAVLWRHRGRALLRVPALAGLAALVAVFLHQSLPLRAHDEFAGSFTISQQIADLAQGRRAIYLWEPDEPCCLFPRALFSVPVWLQHDQVSGLLPPEPADRARLLATYRRAFPGAPIFVVARGGLLPAGVAAGSVRFLQRITTTLPWWQESDTERPDHANRLPVDLEVWQLLGT